MICHACKVGIHTGEQLREILVIQGRQFGKRANGFPVVCRGGTWCDCQHRTDVPR